MGEGITAELRNRTERENVVAAGNGDFDGAFDMLLTLNLAETKFLFGGSGFGPTIECGPELKRWRGENCLSQSEALPVLNEVGLEVTLDSLQNWGTSGGTPARRLHCPS